ncbi:MAG: hypothetical protein APF84_18135 [Gracilibacter sp. BRH_c7a]|nr:MAG: hypothetical protein APF84_18135 [Gracilibacter sp. BRH_c7a]
MATDTKHSNPESIRANANNKHQYRERIIVSIVITIIALSISSAFYSYCNNKKAIKIVQNSTLYTSQETTDETLKRWILKDEGIVRIYGWSALRVDPQFYFVSFAFDSDYNYCNGWDLYSFEVDIKNNVVRKISEDKTLKEKYQRLRFID